MRLSPGTTLGHYQISYLLGAGGMGEVYLAQDQRLRRPVALKLLPSDFTLDKDRLARFEQEAYAASALNHPNILTIYEIGQADEIPFIATEFIDGVTLRQQMTTHQMDLSQILDTVVQIASALAAAHQARIVHRDVKPENIMVRHDGYLKVLDFGLAKLIEHEARAADPEAETEHAVKTSPGQVIGTVAYMSPEQARGFQVDERTDVWSLGALIYEMVTGMLPFDGLTKSDVIALILRTEPLPLARYSSEAPSELQRIVKKALRKDRSERYQTIKDMELDLKNLRREIETGHLTQHPVSSLAILPFKNLTNDATVSFYEFSLADAVITELARLRSLVVRPSSAISKYLGHTKDPLEAGRELKVNAVLAASFLHVAKRVRVTAQLLDVENGSILWSDRIDSEAGDIIGVQDTIAERIVAGLHLELGSDEEVDLAGHATANSAAYEEYLRGRDLVGRYVYHTLANEDIEAAIKHFQRSIELDSGFALAHCALGSCYMQRNLKGAGTATDFTRAQEHFDRGLRLDPKILDARVYMVLVHVLRGDKQKARLQISELRREAPNSPRVHYVSGVLFRIDGKYENALDSFDRMLRLNPVDRVTASWNRARIYMYQGRYDVALDELDHVAAVEPTHPLPNIFRAEILFNCGDPATAATLFRKVLQDHPEINAIRPLLAKALSALGEHEAARAQLTERVKEIGILDWDVPYWIASAYAIEGERDEAFEWLERAISLGNENLPWFKTDPVWEPLRTDERFAALMRRVEAGLECST